MTISPSELLRQEVHVVPAQPGFNRITQVLGDGREVVDLCHEPILAWRIETQTYKHHDGDQLIVSNTMPITVGKNCDGDAYCWAVEYPDGRCDLPFDLILESAAELLKYWQHRKDDPRQIDLPFPEEGEHGQ